MGPKLSSMGAGCASVKALDTENAYKTASQLVEKVLKPRL